MSTAYLQGCFNDGTLQFHPFYRVYKNTTFSLTNFPPLKQIKVERIGPAGC